MYDDIRVKDRRSEAQFESWDDPKFRRAFNKTMGRMLWWGIAAFSMLIVVCIIATLFVER